SFEFSTLGGWLATRSAGQNSTKYGKIENMVQSLVIHTPKGVIETHQVPASATGPSLKHLLLGSEGIYGIITEAVLKIHPLPQSQKFSCAFFENFEQGLTCVRTIMQADITPSVVRLSDADETSFFLDLMLSKKWQKKLLPHWFNFKGLGNHPCFMLISCEGQAAHTNFHLDKIRSLIRSTQGKLVPRKFAAKWKKDRFELPYLRDNLMDHGFFIDTLETAAPWSKLLGIYESMKLAFFEQKSHQLLMACHLSHAYKDGASLYFTFMGVQKRGHEIAQWEEIKNLATNVIMSQGGTLSHHHGVGYDHKKWMVQEETPVGIEVLKAIKKELDPEGLLNPGKVV
ncbi:MAG TPA: FAD-linked oxidase C-terminal domain-containing protein, partial [bacterium]|nr:FAD-linked oxidase C-terminal domain-containing protein [bacterium]